MNNIPIMFMAWDKKAQSMRYNEEFLDLSGFMLLPLTDQFELLQLTALHSTTGEKIYNHMIVKDEWGYHFVVDMFNYQLMELLHRLELEIVGNRFQNPELLELCK